MLHNDLQVHQSLHNDIGINMLKNIFLFIPKFKHMTIAISMFINIFPLHTMLKNHLLKYQVNVLC